ncbi:MAG: response regulator [Elusimicrobiales bacterium]|nr:response regulator [Elusimicrobiales bacterium]
MAKILIVDDESSIRELFRYVFEDAGHQVSLAGNGREALAAVQAERPDFMVLDVSMPVMTGKEFVAELGKLAARDPRYKGIPFVVMTGENFMEPELNRAFSTVKGFVCYFAKMTPPEAVLEKAAEAMV